MSILLISVQKDLDVIGLKSLHYCLLKNNYNSTMLYLPVFNPQDTGSTSSLKSFVSSLNPKLIGISLMSVEYFTACRVTDCIREISNSRVLWGGIHPSIAPEECLEHADYVCIGEGEQTMLDIAAAIKDNKALHGINNICYRGNGRIIKNQLYPYIRNLDELPVTDHIPVKSYLQSDGKIIPMDKKVFKKYGRFKGTSFSIMTSRGCPFSCTYCCNNFLSSLYGSRMVRRRSVENIIAEMEKAVKDHPDIKVMNIQDDCFLLAGFDYLKEFCQAYKRRIRRPFILSSIPIYVTYEKLNLLKDAGMAWIRIGLQSGSDRICREIYKRKSFKKDFLNAAEIINKLKFAAIYDVILDNPFESSDDKLETAQALLDTPKPFYAQFYSLTMYAGTEISSMAKAAFPDKIEDYREKEYLTCDRNDILNSIIRFSASSDNFLIRKLIKSYRQDMMGFGFRLLFQMYMLLCILFLEPLNYLRVGMLANGGSFTGLIKSFPGYFTAAFKKYVLQFKKKDD